MSMLHLVCGMTLVQLTMKLTRGGLLILTLSEKHLNNKKSNDVQSIQEVK